MPFRPLSPGALAGLLPRLGAWRAFAVHAALRLLLPPGLSAETALLWGRHLLHTAHATSLAALRPALA